MPTDFATGFGDGAQARQAGERAAMDALSGLGTATPDFAVVFCSPTYDFRAVLDGVRSVTGEVELVGGTSVGEFTDEGVMTSMASAEAGVTVALVASDEMSFFTGLGRNADADMEGAVASAAAELPDTVDHPNLTGLILTSVDWKGEQLLLLTYQEYPIQWIGGGASDAFRENTAVFAGDEVAHEGVVLAAIASDRPLGTAAGHAHEPIGESFEVTRAEDNVVYELDGRPAYDVWKEAVDETVREYYGHSVSDVEDDDRRLFQLMAEMTFGIRTGDGEYKVRSPGTRPRTDGPLHFTETIPEGVGLYPMASRETGVLERAEENVATALSETDGDSIAGAVVFDGICGELVLGEDYYKAVELMNDSLDAPLAGMLSFGEICFRHDDMRGFHNGSLSLLLFPGGP